MSTVSLRGYQHDLVNTVHDRFAMGIRRVLMVLATGGGKTRIFAHIAHAVQRNRKRVLVLVHRRELIKQASEKLIEAGVVAHGIIAPGHPQTNDPVQVASVQTLGRRLADTTMPPPDLIIVDEAHHSIAGQWKDILDAYPKAFVLGVTATPERGDGKGLGVEAGGCFEDMVLGPAVADLIEMGFLCRSVVYAPHRGGPDLSGVGRRGGDFESAALAAVMDKPQITGDAVQHYTRITPGRPAVAFCASVAHAEKVALAFREAGFRGVAASGASTAAERDAAIGGLATGAVQILCTCDLISEGLDVPSIETAILLRPTQSVGLYLQQVGRGLRPAPGKPHLTILDHAGNTIRHGMPDDEREWTLEGRKKRKGKEDAAVVRQCPKCFAMHRPAPKCLQCGHVYEVEPRELEEVEGELQMMTEERLAHLRTAKLSRLIRPGMGREEVEQIRRLRGYKPGWTFHIMKQLRAQAGAEAYL